MFCGKKRSTPLVIFPIKDKKNLYYTLFIWDQNSKSNVILIAKELPYFLDKYKRKLSRVLKKSLQWGFLYISCWLLLQRIKNNLVAHGKEKGFSHFFCCCFWKFDKIRTKEVICRNSFLTPFYCFFFLYLFYTI